MKRKIEENKKAIELRIQQRMSLGEIAKELGISKATASLWLRKYPLTKKEIEQKRSTAWKKANEKYRIANKKLKEKYEIVKIKPKTTKNSNHKLIGEQSALQIASALGKHDYKIFFSLGDSSKIDLIAEDELHNLITIQCKTGIFKGDRFYFDTCSSNWTSTKKFPYDPNVIDIFAVYLRETDQVFIFDVKTSPKTSRCVRLVPTLNRGAYKSTMAEDHLFRPHIHLLLYP